MKIIVSSFITFLSSEMVKIELFRTISSSKKVEVKYVLHDNIKSSFKVQLFVLSRDFVSDDLIHVYKVHIYNLLKFDILL